MDSIIFDLDGTLWDSSDVVVVGWNSVLSCRSIS
ncbi:HAD hydrolase-like protein [Paenibacillus sp. FSL R10-2199]